MTSRRKQRLSPALQRRIDELVAAAPALSPVQQAVISAAFSSLNKPAPQTAA